MLKGFLSEGAKESMMRLGFLVCVVGGNAVGIAAVVLNRDLIGAATLAGAILVPAFGGKFLQKGREAKK